MVADQIGLILLVTCIVAMASRRLRLPYSVGLAAAGIALTQFGGSVQLVPAPALIYTVLLPPLIFEAALQLDWASFRRELPLTLVLAFPGTLLSAAGVAAGMHWLLGWHWMGAAMFGALIAATDPVAVIAAFKDMRAEPRLGLLLEAESLLNDGAAAVAFAILVAAANGAGSGPGAIAGQLGWMVAGGAVVGAAMGGAVLLLAGRTDDHLVEITLTTIAGYGSFLLAERLQMSGVLASLAAGLVVGNVGWQGSISGPGRENVVLFWEYAAFLANSVVFILIGGHAALHARQVFTWGALVVVGLVLAGRILAVVPLSAVFAGRRLRVPVRYQLVLVWGGLRGALGLALALAVPQSVPERPAIIAAAFAVVAFSVFVQGLSMPWMVRALRLTGAAPASLEATRP
jgi:CPA1 family monovalent cation:H+ antiporter